MNIATQWSNDWQTFAALLVELLDSGVTESEICAQFRGCYVQWQGRITSIDLDKEYSPGIAMSMGVIEMPMANSRLFDADHIALYIQSNENESWRSSVVGERVRFTASIPVNANSTPEVVIFEAEGGTKVVMGLGLSDCIRIAD